MKRPLATVVALACLGASLATTAPAAALDKQGSAHGGAVGGGGDGDDAFDVSGAFTAGGSFVNPTYAARPDNTGHALMRYAGHADVDLAGRALSVPLDVNLFTDRDRAGAKKLLPSELDLIGGVTTTNALAKGADVELGARVEHDRPVDHGGITQTYADVRARVLYSLGKVWPSLARDLADGDVSGYATLGCFAFNPSYAARPDNSGLALFRYAGHGELSVAKQHLSIGLDSTFFTDRRAKDPALPSEIDVTYEVIGRLDPLELHLAYERDMPVDRGGLVQSFVYALAVFSFDVRRDVIRPLEAHGKTPPP
jgi:hypothetical protein